MGLSRRRAFWGLAAGAGDPLGLPALLSIALLATAAARAAASDVGTEVLIGGVSMAGSYPPFPAFGRGGVLFETGASDLVREAFDTVLLQGVCREPDIGFEVSRRQPGGAWSAWRPAQVRRFPNGRFWAKAVFEGAGPGSVRLRAVAAHGPAPAVEIFSVDVFAAAGGSGTPSPPPSAPDSVPPSPSPPPVPGPVKPLVHDRDEWKAKSPKEPYAPHEPRLLTQHHSAGLYTSALDDSLQEVFFIQDFHQNGRGWNDIGYHFLIDGAGNIFQGRPETVVGAHVLNHNTGNVGICLLGNYHPPKNDSLNQAQRLALKSLGIWLRERYGVSPDTYKGHRDYNPGTDCPGDRVYSELGAIRDSLRGPAPSGGAVAGGR